MPESTLTDAVAGHYNNPKTAPPAPLRDERIERMLTLRTSSPEEFRRLGSVAAMEAAMYSDSRRAAAAAFAWRPGLRAAPGGSGRRSDVCRRRRPPGGGVPRPPEQRRSAWPTGSGTPAREWRTFLMFNIKPDGTVERRNDGVPHSTTGPQPWWMTRGPKDEREQLGLSALT